MADTKYRTQQEMIEKIANFTDEDIRSTSFNCLFCDVFYSEWGEYPFEIIKGCGDVALIAGMVAQAHGFQGFGFTNCENFKPVNIKV